MAFAAVTILMDTLHQHFLQPTPLFPFRNKTKVKSLYKNLSSLQACLEQDFKVGEYDEAMKGLEAQLRDASVELRFQIEHQLTLFRLGRGMKLRLRSAQKLLPILDGAIKDDIETMDFDSMLDILTKHFMLPASRMPTHIKKSLKSFWTEHQYIFHKSFWTDEYIFNQLQSEYEQESEDEQESENEQESEDEQESEEEREIEEETEEDREIMELGSFEDLWKTIKGETKDEQEIEDEWETEEDQKSDDEREIKEETKDEQESGDKEKRRHLLHEAESIIRQELRSSYLNKYMKQRIQARQRIRQLFMHGIKLTSYINKELLKLKNACHQSKNSQNNNNTASLRVLERNNTMVGCDDEFNTILDYLNQRSSKREIVSIVGMGGIGKTTLARRIYGDASVISWFHCQAWVTISQKYNPRKVFQGLLRSLAPGIYENSEASNYELAEQVYKQVKHRRYLIVVDDIWSTDVWDDLKRCLQDDNNGSRILLTTRQKNVAEYAGSGNHFCHTMRFLDSNESWNLFESKVCNRITVSTDFEKIAREIVGKCKGLALTITVAAGLLSNSKQDLNEWERIAKNVHTSSLDHSNRQYENIIDLSYTFLPHHLKHCFLSFGCFPEEFDQLYEGFIVDFWVSEGFLKVLRSKNLEDVAKESLQDLVDRNLLSFKEINNGLSKEYQMHDVLRELALREAQRENLSCLIEDFGLSFGFKRIQPINSSHTSQPWSSIQSKICSCSSLPHTCNTFSILDLSNGYRYTKELHFHLKFLRGLMLTKTKDANATSYEMFTEFTMGLVHLRWLINGCIFKLTSLPLFMLWNLQKLAVTFHGMDESLSICGLPQLRNLFIYDAVTLVPPRLVHRNLESIKFLDYRSCTKELFVRIPNLRKLGVAEGRTINLKCEASNWFESLAYLYKLEELEVRAGKHLRSKFRNILSMETLRVENFLSNLKKLGLKDTRLKWKDMHVVGMLSKLEILILEYKAVLGRKWEPKDGGFHRLKFLAIDTTNLKCWKATRDHFPVLECLVLTFLPCLKKIPSGFADIATLKSITLCQCLNSIISSAKRIQEKQREYGNDTFVIDILRIENVADYLRDDFSSDYCLG